MKIYFKPMPWLTLFNVLGLALLLRLGFWQKARLEWKTDLLARVEAAAQAPAFTSLAEVTDALEAGDPVDFRRYAVEVSPRADKLPYALYDPSEGGIAWRLYQAVDTDSRPVFLAGQRRLKSDPMNAEALDRTASSGYVRLAPAPLSGFGKWVKSSSNPDTNRWFHFNQNGLWADGQTRLDIWLDEHSPQIETDLPPLRPDIPNNHRDYMWTWFSFAGLLLIFYGLIHRRAGRLRFIA